MMYTQIIIIAILIQFIINFDVMLKRSDEDVFPAHGYYRNFLYGLIPYYLTDAAWGYFESKGLQDLLYFDTVIYFIAMAVSVFLWTKFVIAFLNDTGLFNLILKFIGFTFVIVVCILMLFNVNDPMVFKVGEGCEYIPGQGRFIILLVQTFIFALTSMHTFVLSVRTSGRSRRHHITIGVNSIVMMVLVALQMVYPLYPVYSVACLLCTCLVHTFVLEDEKNDRRKELEKLFKIEDTQAKELISAKRRAYTDSLTGVKNKHSYIEMENDINERIGGQFIKEFAVIVFDLNGLKKVNDTMGHEKGDAFILSACDLIQSYFKNSPLYRIGGDEFVAILEGDDYNLRGSILRQFNEKMEENLKTGEVVIAAGMDVFDFVHDVDFHTVFEHADKKMYERKKELKEMGMN
ncbi:MAG: GGDEF domain-containing protein [Lachnospiraceae bacterium]|nr:GGDEF domain-containing protein [Lachnospiraceae bacterium]